MTGRTVKLLLLLGLSAVLPACEEEKVAQEVIRPVFAIQVIDPVHQ